MRVQLDEGAYMPEKAHDLDAGFDLRSRGDAVIPAYGSMVFDTGVHVEIPAGFVGMVKSKSGMNVRYGLESEGVVDSGYSGSIVVKLYNHSDAHYLVHKGDKITQLVIIPIHPCNEMELVDEINSGERGNSGFGSTGK